MRIRNNGPDQLVFGLHLASGAIVTVPVSMEQAKKDYLERMFEVISDTKAAPKAATVTTPVVVPPTPKPVEHPKAAEKPTPTVKQDSKTGGFYRGKG